MLKSGTDSLLTCKSARDFSQKSSPKLSVVTRLLSVPRFTLCCLAEWTPAFFANCLVLTIDFILGVLELTNGNSLLLILSCSIPFSAWDSGDLVSTFLFCFFYVFNVILCSIISLLLPSSPPWETRLCLLSFMLNPRFCPRLRKCVRAVKYPLMTEVKHADILLITSPPGANTLLTCVKSRHWPR